MTFVADKNGLGAAKYRVQIQDVDRRYSRWIGMMLQYSVYVMLVSVSCVTNWINADTRFTMRVTILAFTLFVVLVPVFASV